MKPKIDKQLDKIIAQVMKESFLEKPSEDFTFKVMDRVTSLKTSEVTTYQPLISKPVWFILFSIVFTLFGYLIMKGDVQKPNYFGMDFSFDLKIFDVFTAVKFSKTTLYATLIFLFMMMIEIPILKNHLEKQLEI